MTETTNPDCKVCDDLDAELELANALMASFCRVLESSKLPPMQVLQAMAKSLGGIYREVAAAHHRGDCQCGWCPDASGDVELDAEGHRCGADPPPANRPQVDDRGGAGVAHILKAMELARSVAG